MKKLMKAMLTIAVLIIGTTVMAQAQGVCQGGITLHGTVIEIFYTGYEEGGFISLDEDTNTEFFFYNKDITVYPRPEKIKVGDKVSFKCGTKIGNTSNFQGVHQAVNIDNLQDRRIEDILDPIFYLAKYEDLKKAFGNDIKAAKNHWLTYGIKECRQSSPTFSIANYLNRYPDLKKAFGSDCVAALEHWLIYGKKEGRNPGIEPPKVVEAPKVVEPPRAVEVPKLKDLRGIVKFFDSVKGVGFIAVEPITENKQVLFLMKDVKKSGLNTLDLNQRVLFDLEIDSKGLQRAVNIRLLVP